MHKSILTLEQAFSLLTCNDKVHVKRDDTKEELEDNEESEKYLKCEVIDIIAIGNMEVNVYIDYTEDAEDDEDDEEDEFDWFEDTRGTMYDIDDEDAYNNNEAEDPNALLNMWGSIGKSIK